MDLLLIFNNLPVFVDRQIATVVVRIYVCVTVSPLYSISKVHPSFWRKLEGNSHCFKERLYLSIIVVLMSFSKSFVFINWTHLRNIFFFNFYVAVGRTQRDIYPPNTFLSVQWSISNCKHSWSRGLPPPA